MEYLGDQQNNYQSETELNDEYYQQNMDDIRQQILQELQQYGNCYIQYSFEKLKTSIENNQYCTIYLPTGSGKSVLIQKIVQLYMNKKFIYVCTLESLKDQMQKKFSNNSALRNLVIQQCRYSEYDELKDNQILCMCYISFIKLIKKDTNFGDKILIFDECHELQYENLLEIQKKYTNKMIFMTGTPVDYANDNIVQQNIVVDFNYQMIKQIQEIKQEYYYPEIIIRNIINSFANQQNKQFQYWQICLKVVQEAVNSKFMLMCLEDACTLNSIASQMNKQFGDILVIYTRSEKDSKDVYYIDSKKLSILEHIYYDEQEQRMRINRIQGTKYKKKYETIKKLLEEKNIQRIVLLSHQNMREGIDLHYFDSLYYDSGETQQHNIIQQIFRVIRSTDKKKSVYVYFSELREDNSKSLQAKKLLQEYTNNQGIHMSQYEKKRQQARLKKKQQYINHDIQKTFDIYEKQYKIKCSDMNKFLNDKYGQINYQKYGDQLLKFDTVDKIFAYLQLYQYQQKKEPCMNIKKSKVFYVKENRDIFDQNINKHPEFEANYKQWCQFRTNLQLNQMNEFQLSQIEDIHIDQEIHILYYDTLLQKSNGNIDILGDIKSYKTYSQYIEEFYQKYFPGQDSEVIYQECIRNSFLFSYLFPISYLNKQIKLDLHQACILLDFTQQIQQFEQVISEMINNRGTIRQNKDIEQILNKRSGNNIVSKLFIFSSKLPNTQYLIDLIIKSHDKKNPNRAQQNKTRGNKDFDQIDGLLDKYLDERKVSNYTVLHFKDQLASYILEQLYQFRNKTGIQLEIEETKQDERARQRSAQIRPPEDRPIELIQKYKQSVLFVNYGIYINGQIYNCRYYMNAIQTSDDTIQFLSVKQKGIKILSSDKKYIDWFINKINNVQQNKKAFTLSGKDEIFQENIEMYQEIQKCLISGDEIGLHTDIATTKYGKGLIEFPRHRLYQKKKIDELKLQEKRNITGQILTIIFVTDI